MDGWIKVHRKLVDSRSFDRLTDSESFKVIKIMLVVNCQPSDYICPKCRTKIALPAGSTAKSTRGIAEFLKVSHTVIVKLLRKMEAAGLIYFFGTACHRCFAFNNWHLYQGEKSEPAPNNDNHFKYLDKINWKPLVSNTGNKGFPILETRGFQEEEYIYPSFSFLKRGDGRPKNLLTTSTEPSTEMSNTMSRSNQLASDVLEYPPESWALAKAHAALVKKINPNSTVNSSRHSTRRWAKAYADFYASFEIGMTWHAIEYCLRWALADKYWRIRISSPAKLFQHWDTIYEQSKRPRKFFKMLFEPNREKTKSTNYAEIEIDDDNLPF